MMKSVETVFVLIKTQIHMAFTAGDIGESSASGEFASIPLFIP